jgi:hypothetical protein
MGKYKKEKTPIKHHNAQKWASEKKGMTSNSP